MESCTAPKVSRQKNISTDPAGTGGKNDCELLCPVLWRPENTTLPDRLINKRIQTTASYSVLTTRYFSDRQTGEQLFGVYRRHLRHGKCTQNFTAEMPLKNTGVDERIILKCMLPRGFASG